MISSTNIYQIKTTDQEGRSMYVFLNLLPLKKAMLDKAFSNKETDIDFSEYGEILASCYGRFPSTEVRKKMKEEYNFDC